MNFETHHELPSHMDHIKLRCDSAVMRCRWIYCLWVYAADENFKKRVLATFHAHCCICFSFSFFFLNACEVSWYIRSPSFSAVLQTHLVQNVMTPIIWEALQDCSQVHLRHKSYFLLMNGTHHVRRIWLTCSPTHLQGSSSVQELLRGQCEAFTE